MDSAATDTQPRRALAEALRLAAAGYALTPVTITRLPTGKKAARFHKGWRHERSWSRDADQIRAWWVDHPDTSFAVGCAVNGIEGVDLDVKPREGIDGVAWWGENVGIAGQLVQDTPSGGMHQIWRARLDGPTLPQEAGLSLGKGVDTRNRAGLFFAAGSYVVGEPGHYTISGVLPKLAELDYTPHDVLELFAGAERRERADRPTDGQIVFHDIDWQSGKVQQALDAIAVHDKAEGGYRKKIQHLGLMYGRIVEQGFTTAEKAEKHWRDVHKGVWGPEVWPENLKDFRDALVDGPRLERWRVGPDPIERPALNAGTESSSTPSRLHNASAMDPFVHEAEIISEEAAEEIERRAFERVVQERLRWHEADAEARRRQAANAAVGRVSIRSGLIDSNALDQVEPPRMLMGELIPHASMGFLGGDTGTYKSFVAISWACHLAAGRAWLGREEFAVDEPVRVLYVAAEGAAGVAQRIESWKADNGSMPAGHMVLYPRSIDLTDRIAVDELAEIVAEDQFGLIVIDTLHQSAPGSEENSSTEFGVVFAAMSAIRHQHEATVLFVDHTGHDGSRLRGTAAKGQAADFVIMAARTGENVPTSQRSIRVTKRKDLATEGSWPIHLVPVEGTRSAVVQIGEIGSVDSPFSLRGGVPWFEHELEEQLPDAVVKVAGHGADSARDAFRVLRYANDDLGYSISEIVKALKERPQLPDRKPPSESTVRRSMRLLSDAGVVFAQGVKYHLSPEFRP